MTKSVKHVLENVVPIAGGAEYAWVCSCPVTRDGYPTLPAALIGHKRHVAAVKANVNRAKKKTEAQMIEADDEDKNRENRENRTRHALKRTGHRLRPDGDLYAILPVDSENFPDPCAVELSLAEVESWAKNQGEKCRMGE